MLYLIAKKIIKMDHVISFSKDKILSDIQTHAVKRMDFTPAKSNKVSIFCIKKMINLIKTLMIKLISCPWNSQYIKTKLWHKSSKAVKS